MQIYTKILIGMTVGATMGLAFGPKSALLDHDLYVLPSGPGVELFTQHDVPESRLTVPAGVSLRLHREEQLGRSPPTRSVTSSASRPGRACDSRSTSACSCSTMTVCCARNSATSATGSTPKPG